ncbi:MAG: amidohydrolase family protein [Dehalococcoidia bacterium]
MTRLIDVHRHLWGFDWFPPSHLRSGAVTRARDTNRSVEQVLDRIRQSPTMDETGSGAIAEMEKYGIDVSVILALDWGYAYGPEEDSTTPVEEFNRLTMEVCKKYPGKLYAMAGIDPRRPRAAKLFEEMVVQHGAVGLKVYPPNGFQPNEEMCFAMYEKAIELDVPVLIHTGGVGSRFAKTRWTWPEWVEEVAVQFPKLRILMGHTNLQTPFESGAYWRGLTAARSKPNIWLDLCDWQVLGAVKDENIPVLLRAMRVFLDTVGPERIVWGTDLPQTGVGRKAQYETQTWADIFKNLPEWGEKYGVRFTEDERDGICFRAAEKVFSNIFAK